MANLRSILFFLLPILLFVSIAKADQDSTETLYGAARAYNVCLHATAGAAAGDFINTVDFTAGACAASACCQVSEDGAAVGNCDNQPVALANGCYNFTASAAELTGQWVKYFLIDQNGPKRFEDEALTLITFGDTSAWHPLDYTTLALEANVEGYADAALATYDGPTDAEMLAGFAGLNDLSAAQVNTECDTALTDYDPPTFTEMDNEFTIVKADLDNPTQYMADVSALATQVSVDALPDAAAVNAEMVDVMATDTHVELAACPVATASYDTLLRYSYMLQRNKMTESGGVQTIYKDNGTTALCEFTTTDDSVTFTRGEATP